MSRVAVFVAGVAGVVVGVLVGRAPSPRALASVASSEPHQERDAHCKAERAEIASTKAQLAICMAYAPTGESASRPKKSPGPPHSPDDRVEQVRHNIEVMRTCPDHVVVRHTDGTVGLFPPDEWPEDGDGILVARRLPNGQLGWYVGPGPRTDPAAFQARPAQGTLTIDGEPAPAEIQQLFIQPDAATP